MKKIILLLITLSVAGAWYLGVFEGESEPTMELEEGYSWLYDGNSLDGWRKIGGDATFQAEGVDIVGRNGPGANTFLRTEKSYGDFNLRMQMRWDEPGNSGVMFRGKQREEDGRVYGYQYELDASERAWSGGIYDEARRGWLASLEINEEARKAIKLDGWNDIEIEARGGKLQTWINGVVAADIVDGFDDTGFVALQVHSGGKGIMRWRFIRIKEMDPVALAQDALTSQDWIASDITGLTIEGDTVIGSPAGENPVLESRRRFHDVRVSFDIPVCDTPTRIRMRYDSGEMAGTESYAEVLLYRGRAEGKLVTPDEVIEAEAVGLAERDTYTFTGVTVGDGATLSIDETDVLRVRSGMMANRGKLQITPAACGEQFALNKIGLTSLRENREEVSFYKTLDNAPAPVLSPAEALESFRIAPGFKIELVAAEPMVEDPVAMAWDEFGRLYVVELRGYMPDAYGTGRNEPVGQVVRLTDDNGDGLMDRSEVVLGGLVNPRAVAVVNDGVLIGVPPDLLLCEVADEAACSPTRVGPYADSKDEVNVEHRENRLLPGLDNWLYNSKSARRMRLKDGQFESAEGITRGQWGIAKDDVGRLYYNHNSTWVQTDFFQADQIAVPGVDAVYAGVGVTLVDPPEVHSVRVNPGVNRAYLEGTLREDGRLNVATGASGIAIYRGDQFPAEYKGHAFVPESAGNVVAHISIDSDGIEISGEKQLYADEQWGQRDFLGSTDERFRPVDAANGPDGALYVIDMYRGIIQDEHFLTDELREQILQRQLERPIGMGRIWRISYEENETATAIKPGDADAQTLIAYLSHPNGWVRDTAQRLLLVSDATVTAGLAAVAKGDNTVAALHAIWTLQGRGELQPALLMEILALPDAHRRIQALRAAEGVLSGEQLIQASELLIDAEESVLLQLAFAMGQHSDSAEVRARLVELLDSKHAGLYLRQAVVRSVLGKELEFLQEVYAAGELGIEDDANAAALRDLTASAYRSIRGDLTSTEEPDAALLELLALAGSRSGSNSWQQVAMLAGFESMTLADGFVPANLAEAPPTFTDATISENDPLWEARLAGRLAFTWPGDEMALGIKPLSPEQLALMDKGRAYYPTCGNCHGKSGKGTPGLAPALSGVDWVTGPPEWLGRIILQGLSGPIEINGEQWDGVMPPHGHLKELDDETLAGLMTFLRRSWGNKASPVSPEEAAEIRSASSGRSKPWTATELQEVPFDRGFARFVGKYKLSFMTISISERKEGLYMSVPLRGEGVLTQDSETRFSGAAGGEVVKLEFEVDGDNPSPKFYLHYNGERLGFKRKE
ncbi:DUF1080 domain-containing protein [Halioglobus maricola]|uniref:DUF1080 domain-containing protein n=1 Tax=Halioglobus maricola TaxID=2601894 RepID=A0A5P9NJK4_9GAMM|nr:family 16 glycoside hydrolase [Halioglobus maricola]QFU75947.1 DUF1080 domain-containing protein [Halioglobus maricola]